VHIVQNLDHFWILQNFHEVINECSVCICFDKNPLFQLQEVVFNKVDIGLFELQPRMRLFRYKFERFKELLEFHSANRSLCRC
jgi:hypothetical protein